jgi:hypothetical protein
MPRLVLALLPAVAVALIAPAADAATPRAFTVIATQTASKQGTKSITFRETLASGKKVVGHDQVTCKQATKASLRCVATFTVSKGVIRVAGSVFYAKAANTLAITGGSGSYTAAKGTLTLRDLTSKTTAESFTFR